MTFTTVYSCNNTAYTAIMSTFVVELVKGADKDNSKTVSLDGWDCLLEEHEGDVAAIYAAL